MAAGLSSKQIYQRIYHRLNRLAHKLRESLGDAIEELHYTDRELVGVISGKPVNLYYAVLRASNGECAGMLHAVVDGKDSGHLYGDYSRIIKQVKMMLGIGEDV